MKLSLLPALGFLLLLCEMALAQPIKVTTGEHDDFTRVVVALPTDSTWEVEREGREVNLWLSNTRDNFNIDSVFDRIPRARLVDVIVGDEGLKLLLGCQCELSSFEFEGEYIVIDISDSNAEKLNQYSGSIAIEGSKVTSKSDISKTIAAVPVDDLHGIVDFWVNAKIGQKIVNEIEISRNEGTLISQNPVRENQEENKPIAEGISSVFESPLRRYSAKPIWENIRIGNREDEYFDGIIDFEGAFANNGHCGDEVEIYAWADENSYSDQISKARRELYNDIDDLDVAAAERLAKLYLYFGFGVEAKQVLNAIVIQDVEYNILYVISEIIQFGYLLNSSSLRENIPCKEDANIWEFLAFEDHPEYIVFDGGVLMLQYNNLPMHLRSVIASGFAERLHHFGKTDMANMVFQDAYRSTISNPEELKMVAATLALSEGQEKDSIGYLKEVVESNSIEAPNALVQLVELEHLDINRSVGVDTIELVESYLQEYSGTELEESLVRANILGLASNLQIEAAFQLLDEYGSVFIRSDEVELYLGLMEYLISYPEDVVFLSIALAISEVEISKLEERHILGLVQRLNSLGFSSEAQNLISRVSQADKNSEFQLAAAEAAIRLNQPFNALAELLGLTHKEANALRAIANDMVGNHDQAYSLHRAAGNPERAMQSAFLAENWENEILESNDILGAVSSVMLNKELPNDIADGMLQRSSIVLEESNAARIAISNLLDWSISE
jgi:hypothetical protein